MAVAPAPAPAPAVADVDDCGLNVNQTSRKRSRYLLIGEQSRVPSGGLVSRAVTGKDENPIELLVHTDIPSRNEQAIDMGAVAAAILHGVFPIESLLVAFKRTGKLDEVKQALAKVS